MIKAENGIFEVEGKYTDCLSDLTIIASGMAETLSHREDINRIEAAEFVITSFILGLVNHLDKEHLEDNVSKVKFAKSVKTMTDVMLSMAVCEVAELTDFSNIHQLKDDLDKVAEAIIMKR